MLDRIITWSLGHRFLVIVLALIFIGAGMHALLNLRIDAFPDTTPVQVQVNTVAPALLPLEIEQQITLPVEQTLGGLRGLLEVRSISKPGLSQVTAVFDDALDIFFARQMVMEQLQSVELPEGISRPEIGPVASGLGEIYHYLVTGEGKTLEELTTLHEWVIKPRLRAVSGVAEVNTWGGRVRQFHVLTDLSRLVKYELSLNDVFEALRRNNMNVGGGNISQAGELHLVYGVGRPGSIREIENIIVAYKETMPVLVRDVADVSEGHEIRRGAVTANGEGEVVLGLGFMLMGENSHQVAQRLKARMDEIKTALPPGVDIITVYDRTDLVDQVLATVKKNLFEGAILVVAVLFLFLGNLRAGLIVASAIPLSMLFAAQGMLRFGVAGSLMSLGAIDFGLIVDSSVIMVENSVRHLGENRSDRSRLDIVRDASIEVRKPTMFGELIIMIVYLPVLVLEGIEGKLFRPMALTVIFALVGSLILSLTLMPVLASIFLPSKVRERENVVVGFAKQAYRPIVCFAMRRRMAVISVAIACAGAGLLLSARIGSEFIPRLSEMGIVINTVRLAGVSLDESIRYGTQLEKVIRERFPEEVRNVWVRTGTAEVATDPMGIELSDVFITLRPRRQWKRARTQEDLTNLMRTELSGFPGMRMIFTQPIEMRVNEMIAGIRSDLGIKVFGDDLEILQAQAAEVERIIKSIPGSADVYTEQITGQPVLRLEIDQDAVARHGVSTADVLDIVEAIGGKQAGEIWEDQRHLALVMRLGERYRHSPEAVAGILVPAANGERIPLARLARISQIEGPSTITREWQKRRIVVQCNVRGRDVGGFVEEVRDRLGEESNLPAGYYISYGGQFEHLERARSRLMIVVPMALLLIIILLYLSTDSLRDTLLIFTGAPFATIGGILALWVRGMPFTISAGVGFVAVSGVAMLNGLILVSTIKQLRNQGKGLDRAIEESALLRLRPILMTALVASLGFVPMAFNTGVGAEVQRPLATVVIGGVIFDNLLTLLVFPALYSVFGREFTMDKIENEAALCDV